MKHNVVVHGMLHLPERQGVFAQVEHSEAK